MLKVKQEYYSFFYLNESESEPKTLLPRQDAFGLQPKNFETFLEGGKLSERKENRFPQLFILNYRTTLHMFNSMISNVSAEASFNVGKC